MTKPLHNPFKFKKEKPLLPDLWNTICKNYKTHTAEYTIEDIQYGILLYLSGASNFHSAAMELTTNEDVIKQATRELTIYMYNHIATDYSYYEYIDNSLGLSDKLWYRLLNTPSMTRGLLVAICDDTLTSNINRALKEITHTDDSTYRTIQRRDEILASYSNYIKVIKTLPTTTVSNKEELAHILFVEILKGHDSCGFFRYEGDQDEA